MSIDREILEKPLLFLPTLVTNSSSQALPASYGTKRVFFKLVGTQLYLLENTEGQSMIGPFKPEKIIAEFSIIDQNEHRIHFDFKAGFDRIIIGARAVAEEAYDLVANVSASYLRDPVSDGNLFGVSHIAQIAGDDPETLTFTYAFVPERPPLFAPVPAPHSSSGVGYFVTSPSYDQGTSDEHRFISRWDISRPIIFSLSPNTPEEFRGALREGIEVWNDVFGRKVVTVQDAPDGVTIGDPRYNIIQWIEFDDDGLARADWHIHPLTGQVLHANVLFLSGWAVLSKEEAIKFLSSWEAEGETHSDQVKNELRYSLRGFETTKLCELRPDHSYRAFLQQVVDGDIPEEEILPLVKRVLKTIIMHEVGHDLGLRHNFAGSLGTEILPSQDLPDLTNLLLTGERPVEAPLPSSSVMDYVTIFDDIRMERPGPYDHAAIRWGYLASSEERAAMQLPLFCTDEDTTWDADCQMWDAWAEPINWYLTFNIPLKVRRFNTMFLEQLEGQSEQAVMRPWWTNDLERLMNHIGGRMNVRDLGGRTADERIRRAAEVIVPFLFSGDTTTAPAGAIVRPEMLAKRNEFDAEITAVIMRAHDETLIKVLSMIQDDHNRLTVAAAAETPILNGLVSVAANAGFRAWFADAEELRREATKLIANQTNDAGRRAQSTLRQKLETNIKLFMANANETGAQEKIALEEELISILPSIPRPQP
ncbi:MAG: zinc-dependent metalloprotease [Deltaproteobacteria bacterium]|nr:zinc-dependent metalloprotease [Deltaproteobacteria bacterium]